MGRLSYIVIIIVIAAATILSLLLLQNIFTRKREAEQLRQRMLQQEREATKRLKDSEALYASLVDNLDQCLIRKDLESRLTFANEAFCRLHGVTLDQLIGTTGLELLDPLGYHPTQARGRATQATPCREPGFLPGTIQRSHRR